MFGYECNRVLILLQSFLPELRWMIQTGFVILAKGKRTLLKRKKPKFTVLDYVRQCPFTDDNRPMRGINGSDHNFVWPDWKYMSSLLFVGKLRMKENGSPKPYRLHWNRSIAWSNSAWVFSACGL